MRIAALAKRCGRLDALKAVDLEVGAGEAFGLVGANGAGKTTLIRCVLDLAAYDRGEIAIFGVDARRPGARARRDAAREARLLEELELEREALERPVASLSKGMTQKLGLAACLLAQRDLYLLDEPMSGLDPAARVAVKSVLRRLSAEGRTLFFTSHVLADVEELCSSIAVLDRGRVRFRGTPAALCARYAETRLERAFMRCTRDDDPATGA